MPRRGTALRQVGVAMQKGMTEVMWYLLRRFWCSPTTPRTIFCSSWPSSGVSLRSGESRSTDAGGLLTRLRPIPAPPLPENSISSHGSLISRGEGSALPSVLTPARSDRQTRFCHLQEGGKRRELYWATKSSRRWKLIFEWLKMFQQCDVALRVQACPRAPCPYRSSSAP
jgi:hypothetical protein